MNVPTTAKIFMSGRSQAVRLPFAYRFDTDEVYIRKDEITGDIILSAKNNTTDNWNDLFAIFAEPHDATTQHDMDDFFAKTQGKTSEVAITPTDPFQDWRE